MKNSKILLGGLIGSLAIVFLLSSSAQSFSITQDAFDPTSAKDSQSVGEEPSFLEHEVLSLTEIFERSEAGVVSIMIQKSHDLLASNGVGSGFVYDNQGHIITNNHVVENAEKITVTFVDGVSYKAKVVGTDPFTDLAVIKIDVDSSKLHPIPLGDSSKLKVGERITAIGNPFGLSGSMTAGIVSQMGRLLPSQESGFTIPDVIQTDAVINPGNSGGPLLNMRGQVVGINSSIYSTDGNFSGVGFSIPSNTVSKIVPILIKDGQYKHPFIGISTVNIVPDLANVLELEDAKGLLVMTVVKDGPADKAGIRGSSQTVKSDRTEYQIGGDIILSMDGNEVRKIEDLITYLQREKNVGDTINLGIIRDGISTNIVVQLGERPT